MDLKKAVRGDTTQDAERTSVRTRDGRALSDERAVLDGRVSEERLVTDGGVADGVGADKLEQDDAMLNEHERVTFAPPPYGSVGPVGRLESSGLDRASVVDRASAERLSADRFSTDRFSVTDRYAEAERSSAVEQTLPSDAFLDSTRSPEGSFFRADEERATTLVLMESGAFWPGWVKEVQRRAPNSMVEVQSASESVEGFGGRVLRRLVSLRDRGVRLRAAVYAAASPVTEQERGVRRLLCSTLLDVLGDGGELVLSGEGWSTWGVDARSRADLIALAGDLSYELPRSTVPPPISRSGAGGGTKTKASEAQLSQRAGRARKVTVSVRFGDAPDESGVHKAAKPLERGPAVRRAEGHSQAEALGAEADDDDELTREIA